MTHGVTPEAWDGGDGTPGALATTYTSCQVILTRDQCFPFKHTFEGNSPLGNEPTQHLCSSVTEKGVTLMACDPLTK